MSVDTFCARNEISRSLFYTLVKQGHGPALMRLGGVLRISTEAERAWQRACEERTKALPMPPDRAEGSHGRGRPKKRAA